MKSRHFLPFLWILLPVITGVRTWQLAVAVDEAGFYTEQYLTLCNILSYVVLGITVLLLLAGRYFIKNHAALQPPQKNTALSIASFVLAASCVPQAMVDFQNALTVGEQISSLLPTALLAAAFTVIGTHQLMGRTVPFGITVLPVLTEFSRLVICYAKYNGIAQISENVIYILFLCSFLVFVLAHSRVYSGVDSKKGLGTAYGSGAATAIFGLCASVPHWIMGQNQYPLSMIVFGAAVYAVVFLCVMAFADPVETEESFDPTAPPVDESEHSEAVPAAEPAQDPLDASEQAEDQTPTPAADYHKDVISQVFDDIRRDILGE